MKLNISIIILAFLFFSCKKENIISNEEENTYKVLSVLYNDLTRQEIIYSAFPAPPPNPNISWDSINKNMELDRKIEKDTLKIIDDLIKKNGRLIVAINSTLFVPYTDDFKNEHFKDYLDNYRELFYSFKKIKDSLLIDVSKIPINKYSYILPYQEYYSKMPKRGYDKYDINLNFSRIAFNKKNNKAIVIMGVGFGKLNGFSAMYFLEKTKGKWFIKQEKGLSIS
jgi:hypothetical protein